MLYIAYRVVLAIHVVDLIVFTPVEHIVDHENLPGWEGLGSQICA